MLEICFRKTFIINIIVMSSQTVNSRASNQKIVQLTVCHNWNDSRIFHKITASLIKSGLYVNLVAPAKGGKSKECRVYLIHVPQLRLLRMIFGPFLSIVAVMKIRPYLIHYHDPELVPVSFLFRLMGIRVIYDVHESLPSQVMAKSYIPYCLRSTIAQLSRILQFVGIKVSCAATAATPGIVKELGENVRLVQNFPIKGELEKAKRKSIRERSNLIYYVGNITRLRGAIEMIEAVRIVSEKKSVKLLLAGWFPEKCGLEEEIRKKYKRELIDIIGIQSRCEIRDTLSEVKVGLSVLHPTPGYYEGWPIKLFEYMSAGVPVVASNFPLLRKIVVGSQSGLVVDPLNTEAIAEAILYLLENPEESEKMGLAGRMAVEQVYNWDKEFSRLKELYQELGVRF